jgi:hypothetical protein
MRTSVLALAGIGVLAAAVPARGAPASRHEIAIDARGPLAFVEITRELPPPDKSGAAEALLDIALPDQSALVSVELRDQGRWRPIETAAAASPGEAYYDESKARGVAPLYEPFDDSTDFRMRVQTGPTARGGGPPVVRYRFSAIPAFSNGRFRIRFPAAPERMPVPAGVTVTARKAADVDIAGTRAAAGDAGTTRARGQASTRSGWEVSWAPRDPAAAPAAPTLDARVAIAPVPGGAATTLGYSIRSRPARSAGAPTSVLLVIDRSRSVGLRGLSAEHDLARRVLEALPPSTRFDALFFDRGSKRLFPMSRPATREAIGALEGEMVPARMQNGTDLTAALRDAGALLRREHSTFAPRALLLLLTDGALPATDGPALDRALGAVPEMDLSVAAFIVRPPDDDPASPEARRALHDFAASRHGVARVLRLAEIGDAVTGVLADIDHGGDAAAVRLKVDGRLYPLAPSLAPDAALSGVVSIAGKPPRAVEVEAMVHGKRVALPVHAARPPAAWLRGRTAGAPQPEKARMLVTPSLLALVEPIVRAAPDPEPAVRGSMDRLVMRNVLSLAYMPRARACYLARTGKNAASRDLTGKVRLAIDVVRGEVERASIESSTLNRADVELCLREGAFEIEVPRVVRNDAPVTAILNLVFRPQTPEKKRADDLGAVGDQIDLLIEEAQRRDEQAARTETPPDPEGAKSAPPAQTR